MRRLILRTITATMALCLFGPAVPAVANPDGSHGGTGTFPLVCDGELSTLTVGGGPWSAAHIAESGKTFVPVSTTLSMRDAQTYELLYEEHDAKGKPRGGPVRCVDEFVVDGVLITFTVHGHLH